MSSNKQRTIGLLQHQETFKETRRGNITKESGSNKGESPARRKSRSPDKSVRTSKTMKDVIKRKSSSPRKGKGSPRRASGKDSQRRELANLNMSANKEFDFLYDKKRADGQDDPDQIWLRNRAIDEKPERQSRGRRNSSPSRRGEKSSSNAGGKSGWTNPQGVTFGLLLITTCLLYIFFQTHRPYCTSAGQNQPLCSSPEGNWLNPFQCRECPANAQCHAGQMACNKGYTPVEGEVCLTADDNPYVAQLVGYLMRIDEGIRWNQNFKHFGAAHPQKITGEEILDQLEYLIDVHDEDRRSTEVGRGHVEHELRRQTERERANAGAAILTVLADKKAGTKYCIGQRFQSKNLQDFVDWSDIEVASRKLGWPGTP